MNHKIQISVDEELNDLIKSGAEDMGLSISSYARLMLLSILPKKNKKNKGLLSQGMQDLEKGRVHPITLEKFKAQLNRL
jgi:antitoxin component of RelBE/YafQ-DinJ toxin-antitoxin module